MNTITIVFKRVSEPQRIDSISSYQDGAFFCVDEIDQATQEIRVTMFPIADILHVEVGQSRS
jgi:hypothetical protein